MNRAVRAAMIGVLLFTPVALSACSAGQIAQTDTQNRDKYGAFALVGDLTIVSAALAYPPGGSYAAGDDAELVMVVANPTPQSDVLVSMSGPDFAGVRVAGMGTSPRASSSGGAGSSAGSASASATGTGTPSATSTTGNEAGSGLEGPASGGATASGSIPSSSLSASPLPTGALTSTSPLPTPAGGGDHVGITIPGNSNVNLGENAPHVFLTNLARPITAAGIVQVTMTFQKAGTVTVPAIVTPPLDVIPNTSTYNFNQEPGKLRQGSAHGA